MKIVIQKVKNASVDVEGILYNKINEGFVLLVGIEEGDTVEDLKRASTKIANMRIFEDNDGKMNHSILDVGGKILSISQFTLAADVRKGNRPSFTQAMNAEQANDLFETFNDLLRTEGLIVKTGKFQTHMNVKLDNDGPVTIILEVRDGKVI
ncbi:D-aminoacyl-tRNA deacylase [Erysipelothrix urinaevulpis]|uniref:D-aminoacyl-tRNA deacylase n=1 Tax=Erysipelothrix urinaevulpis TaxID=2683717 RepID=UPI00135B4A0A|nr:D-aminoacyl-tRNA deacylase [Erysipelothrix urinaevulpis]